MLISVFIDRERPSCLTAIAGRYHLSHDLDYCTQLSLLLSLAVSLSLSLYYSDSALSQFVSAWAFSKLTNTPTDCMHSLPVSVINNLCIVVHTSKI